MPESGLSPGLCPSVCPQEDVYRATTQPLVEGVISGYNATVFAYGPSGAQGSVSRKDWGWGRPTLPDSPKHLLCAGAALGSAPSSLREAALKGRSTQPLSRMRALSPR